MNLRKFNKDSRNDLELLQRIEKLHNIEDSLTINMNLNIQPHIYKDNLKEGVVYLNSMFRCVPVFIDEPQDGFLRIEYTTIPYNLQAGDEYQKLISSLYKKDVLGKDLSISTDEATTEETDVFTTNRE